MYITHSTSPYNEEYSLQQLYDIDKQQYQQVILINPSLYSMSLCIFRMSISHLFLSIPLYLPSKCSHYLAIIQRSSNGHYQNLLQMKSSDLNCEGIADVQFRSSISGFFLHFHETSLESTYKHYALKIRKVPSCLKWLMSALIIMIGIRKLALVAFSYTDATAEVQRPDIELISFCIYLGSWIVEGVIMWFPRFIPLKGFTFLVAAFLIENFIFYVNFFQTLGSAITYFLKVLIKRRLIPVYMGCVYLCIWYMYSWIVAATACCVGITLTTAFVVQLDRQLYETISYVLLFCWAYASLTLASYFSEYNSRSQFYNAYKILSERNQWRALLDKLPLNILLVGCGRVQFMNEECARLFGVPKCFNEVKESGGSMTVNDLICDPGNLSRIENTQFVYEKATVKSFFKLLHFTITFENQEMTAILLYDQTASEELKTLDQKYHKLYTASVAHNVRTPLNGIMGMLDVVQEHPIPEEAKEFIEVARDSGKLLLYFVNNLWDLTQTQLGTLIIKDTLFSPVGAVYECIQMFKRSFERKGVKLEIEVKLETPESIASDKRRYMQILINLLDNALKFTNRGEVYISVGYEKENDSLWTTVKDTGYGIKQEDLPCLFKLYGGVQAEAGIGIGLTVSKNLSEALGGHIAVDSAYGLGSTFTFTVACGLRKPSRTPRVNFSSEFPPDFAEEKHGPSPENESRNFLLLVHDNPMIDCPIPPESDQPTKKRIIEEKGFLIVDDNDSDFLILKSYAEFFNISSDIVIQQ
eukprot:TRINITY_DN2001_c2_g1_i1.p1 TRINITY_DN2001_c2_g1~~TRINITY_DN2001_c2_g1_i1.p1  ORF type:complete len:789 (-),score=34.14 TRINITY_DN2001_c2_g1_i1:369-2633(-)